jgi:hypothetical protein
MPRVGFEHMILVFWRMMTFQALDCMETITSFCTEILVILEFTTLTASSLFAYGK